MLYKKIVLPDLNYENGFYLEYKFRNEIGEAGYTIDPRYKIAYSPDEAGKLTPLEQCLRFTEIFIAMYRNTNDRVISNYINSGFLPVIATTNSRSHKEVSDYIENLFNEYSIEILKLPQYTPGNPHYKDLDKVGPELDLWVHRTDIKNMLGKEEHVIRHNDLMALLRL